MKLKRPARSYAPYLGIEITDPGWGLLPPIAWTNEFLPSVLHIVK